MPSISLPGQRAERQGRPEPTAADLAFQDAAYTPVGDAKAGIVYSLNESMGVAYVMEEGTGRSFPVARRFLGEQFNRLADGLTVHFLVNKFNSVVKLQA